MEYQYKMPFATFESEVISTLYIIYFCTVYFTPISGMD